MQLKQPVKFHFQCSRCGTAFSSKSNFFYTSHAPLYRGMGYLPVCKQCVETIYEDYLRELKDQRLAVKETCRKLDLYFSSKIYESVKEKATARTMMSLYISRCNTKTYVGKSYDDTLHEEQLVATSHAETVSPIEIATPLEELPEEIIAFWGTGYTAEMYTELEQRRKYWMSRLPQGTELDIGAEAIIRQICNLEIDINRDRVAGKPIDKSVNALNTLLGSASLKPTQKKESSDSADTTPFGVWIRRFENERPIPECDPELADADKIVRYVDTWYRGHLCKMLGIQSNTAKLYEQAIDDLRVEHPEFEEDDDESLIYDIFSNAEDEVADGAD